MKYVEQRSSVNETDTDNAQESPDSDLFISATASNKMQQLGKAKPEISP